ncbi:hypothetical protein [Kitasatospora aureofaciens]|uniref:hypothetical protein n=1 Tax=Kitasatospora aureofaciens TaxID=1894 RepID=UPI001C46C41C|nr:hypothetical protein [Kitasatospora aureofaciens]MBV6699889.1 hypothetical protein [Kitasatospora aureofaciens]
MSRTATRNGTASALGKELVMIPGAHVPQLTHPSAVADTIRRTIGEVNRPAAGGRS